MRQEWLILSKRCYLVSTKNKSVIQEQLWGWSRLSNRKTQTAREAKPAPDCWHCHHLQSCEKHQSHFTFLIKYLGILTFGHEAACFAVEDSSLEALKDFIKGTDVPAKGPGRPELGNDSRAAQLRVGVNRRDDTAAKSRDLLSTPSLAKAWRSHQTPCILHFSLDNAGTAAAEGNVSVEVVWTSPKALTQQSA